MIFPITDLLAIEILMPSRWVPGEARRVAMRLHNFSGLDVTQVHWRPCWEDMLGADEHWRELGMLRRETSLPLEFRMPAPAQAGEDFFQLHLRGQVGSLLRLELWSAKLGIEVRVRHGAGDVQVVIQGGIQGDKIGFGAMSGDGGSGVGHVVNFHGSNPQRDFQDWLAADATATEWQPLPLHLAKDHYQVWSNSLGMEMVGIQAGEFRMGAADSDPEADAALERPARGVRLTRGFWMSSRLVTNELHSRVMEQPSPVTLTGHQGPMMPVSKVTWGMAAAFCEKLTTLEQSAGLLPTGYRYRLPTEAEWEYACRAGTEAPRYGLLKEIGSVPANGGRMMSVGSFQANAWGLYDMIGLVWEWCHDAFAAYKRVAELCDPVCQEVAVGAPLARVVRGGCYQPVSEATQPDAFCRASARFGVAPDHSSHRIGFRVALAREI